MKRSLRKERLGPKPELSQGPKRWKKSNFAMRKRKVLLTVTRAPGLNYLQCHRSENNKLTALGTAWHTVFL